MSEHTVTGDVATAAASVLARARRADIRLDPYPHMVIENALPQATYDALAAAFPPLDWVAGEEAAENNRVCLKGAAQVRGNPAIHPAWQGFFDYHLSRAFFEEFVDLWGDVVARVHPGIEDNFGRALADFRVATRASGKAAAHANREADLVLDCVFGMNTPVTRPVPARGPHIDSPVKLFSSLLYFRDPADGSRGGEHQMHGLRRRMYPRGRRKKIPERYVVARQAVPYRANTLLFWINTALSIHSVTPREVTPLPRRYVAITGECYGGRATGGFFGHHPQWNTLGGRLRSLVNV